MVATSENMRKSDIIAIKKAEQVEHHSKVWKNLY